MAAVDFDLRFTFVLAGWEGTTHDALVLRDALERPNGLRVPQGKTELVVNLLYSWYATILEPSHACPLYDRKVLPS